MHTLALLKYVLCIELGQQWPLAHYELAHLIKKKKRHTNDQFRKMVGWRRYGVEKCGKGKRGKTLIKVETPPPRHTNL